MKTIEERAELNLMYEKDFCGYSLSDDMVCRAYVRGAEEQKAIDDEATLKGFTTDELRAELKRRAAEEKAKKDSTLRCRMCKHWGEVSYWGFPTNYYYVSDSRSCRFFKTKNGKYYRCHRASQPACKHFERKEEQL